MRANVVGIVRNTDATPLPCSSGRRAPQPRSSCRPAVLLLFLAATAFACMASPADARAATPTLVSIGRMAAPAFSRLDTPIAPPPQEPRAQAPPPFADPAGGAVFSLLGGSVFSGASAFQTGAAFAYFFGTKASIGVEVEGNMTFGPGGRVVQGMGSLILQTGARTSKFVPYFAIGGGYLRATSNLPAETESVLADFGINPEPKTAQSPFLHMGGGVRFYIKPNVSFRADVRFAQVLLGVEELGFWDRLYAIRRVAGMLSWDF